MEVGAPTPPSQTTPFESPDQEIQRLRLALVGEMERRRRAEKWANEAVQISAQFPEPSLDLTLRRSWFAQHRVGTAIAVFAAGSLMWGGIAAWARKRAEEVRIANLTVSSLRPSAEQFAAQAEDLVDQQDWDGARQQLAYALTLTPERAAWRSRLADIYLAQYNFEQALAAYRQAAADDPKVLDPWDGITVCERLLRAREISGRPSVSALYAVHRTLLRHGRLAEAVKVASSLKDDPDLQQRTWQERLQKGGLDADIQLNESRRLTVRLRGPVQEHLDLLRGIPATAIWMPETDVHDLTALAGLSVEELDLSHTMVAKLDALRGMPLRRLNLDRTQVEDLLPLRGSPIEELHLSRTAVRLISSLRSMPLRKLDISSTKIVDLQPLATVPLKELDASSTPVSDLAPLAHLPVTTLRLDDTLVTDLTPLRGAPISVLSLARTPITSVEPLADSRITFLSLSGCSQITDLKPLATARDLQKLIVPTKTDPKEVQAILPQVKFIE